MATHKVVKVRITRGAGGGMKYPKRFKAYEIAGQGLSRGEGEGHCLVILPDGMADEYSLDPDMEVVTTAEADALLEEWRVAKGQPAEVVTDANRVALVTAKCLAKVPLTQEDLDALDPSTDVPGVERRPKPLKSRYPSIL